MRARSCDGKNDRACGGATLRVTLTADDEDTFGERTRGAVNEASDQYHAMSLNRVRII